MSSQFRKICRAFSSGIIRHPSGSDINAMGQQVLRLPVIRIILISGISILLQCSASKGLDPGDPGTPEYWAINTVRCSMGMCYAADTTAPEAPAETAASAVDSTQINLSWSAPWD